MKSKKEVVVEEEEKEEQADCSRFILTTVEQELESLLHLVHKNNLCHTMDSRNLLEAYRRDNDALWRRTRRMECPEEILHRVVKSLRREEEEEKEKEEEAGEANDIFVNCNTNTTPVKVIVPAFTKGEYYNSKTGGVDTRTDRTLCGSSSSEEGVDVLGIVNSLYGIPPSQSQRHQEMQQQQQPHHHQQPQQQQQQNLRNQLRQHQGSSKVDVFEHPLCSEIKSFDRNNLRKTVIRLEAPTDVSHQDIEDDVEYESSKDDAIERNNEIDDVASSPPRGAGDGGGGNESEFIFPRADTALLLDVSHQSINEDMEYETPECDSIETRNENDDIASSPADGARNGCGGNESVIELEDVAYAIKHDTEHYENIGDIKEEGVCVDACLECVGVVSLDKITGCSDTVGADTPVVVRVISTSEMLQQVLTCPRTPLGDINEGVCVNACPECVEVVTLDEVTALDGAVGADDTPVVAQGVSISEMRQTMLTSPRTPDTVDDDTDTVEDLKNDDSDEDDDMYDAHEPKEVDNTREQSTEEVGESLSTGGITRETKNEDADQSITEAGPNILCTASTFLQSDNVEAAIFTKTETLLSQDFSPLTKTDVINEGKSNHEGATSPELLIDALLDDELMKNANEYLVETLEKIKELKMAGLDGPDKYDSFAYLPQYTKPVSTKTQKHNLLVHRLSRRQLFQCKGSLELCLDVASNAFFSPEDRQVLVVSKDNDKYLVPRYRPPVLPPQPSTKGAPLFKKGQKDSGYYIYISSNGNQYAGNFKDGKRHGYGIATYRNGEVYNGQWRHGNRHGQGVLHLANGDIFDGVWLTNKKNGLGVYYYWTTCGEVDISWYQDNVRLESLRWTKDRRRAYLLDLSSSKKEPISLVRAANMVKDLEIKHELLKHHAQLV